MSLPLRFAPLLGALTACGALHLAPCAGAQTPHAVLLNEHTRGADTRAMDAALRSTDSTLQRLAVRAYGRLEQRRHAPRIEPLLQSTSISVRREAYRALAQMNAAVSATVSDPEPRVRAAHYEALGRVATATGTPSIADATAALQTGLLDASPIAREGAARGVEALMRRTARVARPADATLAALRAAVRANAAAPTRELLLLALNAAGDRDSTTLALALRDTNPDVRRLAVAASRQWVDDANPRVRVQALRVAGTRAHATRLLTDSSLHVVLAAIAALGERRCADAPWDSLTAPARDWRVAARATVALARIDSTRARRAIALLRTHPVWQARAHIASAAKAVGDTATLTLLASDAAPNVAAAALHTRALALAALTRATPPPPRAAGHAGLALAAANALKGSPHLTADAPLLRDALMRLTARRTVMVRDPRMALLERLREAADSTVAASLAPLLRDPDPEVAALAARTMRERAHADVQPVTTRYDPAPFPSAVVLAGLRGATAQIVLRGLGTLEVALHVEDAPATVATFAALAARGAFNGLTWHRVEPNFVLQGGSPGADEYDAIASSFLRDEVGDQSHLRGTFGISTRGHDTGDGQLFINLVNNFRLDHQYTVFATITRGLDIMDRVQEGDVIERITIRRGTAK